MLDKKCRNVRVEMNLNQIFTDLQSVEKLWNHRLIELVEHLPDFDKVISELKKYIMHLS